MLRLIALTVLWLAVAVKASSPAAAVDSAAADLAKLPPQSRQYTRYLSMYPTPDKSRLDLFKALDFLVNSLSKEAEFSHPRRVSADLYAVDVRDYGWDVKVWERLKDSEPYFHALIIEPPSEVNVDEDWPGGVWQGDGKHYAAGAFKTRRKVTKPGGRKVAGAAPWVDAKQISYLISETQSQVPIIRADWFIHQTAIQLDRKVGYYDFLGLGKKQKDFEDLIGADREKSRKVKREIAGVMARSGVTLQNRALLRFQSITGGYWVTQDFKTSLDRQNVLRNLDKDLDPPEGDASEQYGVLPNGLFAFWLQNAKGERQDTAPDFIASDGQASGNDRRVHIGLSCIRCHAEGIRPINDWARQHYRNSIQLATPDYEKYKRLRQLYLSDLEGHVKGDQAYYAAKLMQLNGTKPAEMARLFARAWDDYAERDLTPDNFARELGVDKAKMIAAIKAYATGGADPVLTQVIQDPPLPVIRSHFEEVYSLAQSAIRGYRSP